MLKSTTKLAIGVALALAVGAPSFAQEAKLLAVLKSDASRKEKADACRELARVATKASVPTLSALLADEKLNHMARYAMETLRDPSVDVALREALGKLKGLPLVGVITSVGVRRDAKAAAALAGMLSDADAQVAHAAARALGFIATPEAVKALTAALGKAAGRQQLAVCEGLLRCAERAAAGGKREEALAVYERLRALRGAAHQVRSAALRGCLLTPEKPNLPLLVKALRDKQYVVFSAAVRASMELAGEAVTKALVGELPKLSAERQPLLIHALGARGDAAAGPALLAAAKEGPADTRIGAVRALTRVGHAPAVAMLTELALTDDTKLAAEAQRCLGNFPGKEGQAAVVGLLDHKDAKARRLGVELIGRRALAGAVAVLLKAAKDPDAEVRTASLKVLRDVADTKELPALLGLLTAAKGPTDIRGAAEALRSLCARKATSAGGNVVIVKAVYGVLPGGPMADVTKKVAKLVKAGAASVEASNDNFGDPAHGTSKKFRVEYTVNGVPGSATVGENKTVSFAAKVAPPAFVEAFCAALPKAPTEAKAALLGILRSAGGPAALKAVRAATRDGDAKVKDAAVRALCEWSTPDALPAVAELARTAKNATLKVLAIRGYVRLAAQQAATPAKRVESLKSAMALADRDDEKRLVLSALASIPAPESLALVISCVDSPTLKEEACLAAVMIAMKIVKSHPAPVAEAMKKVAKSTGTKKLADRAEALARQTGRL